MQDNAASRGGQFLRDALDFAETKLGMDADEVAFELVDAIQGDYYPDPPRIFPVTEAIVSRYLDRVVSAGSRQQDRSSVCH